MKKVLALTGLVAALAIAAAPAANAGGQVCYDADVVVNGQALVDESGCQPIG